MTPLNLSTSWTRRVYVALAGMSLGIVVLYVLEALAVTSAEPATAVPLGAAIGSGLVGIVSVVLAILGKKFDSSLPLVTLYGVLTLSIAWLVLQTGAVTSPYAGLWVLSALAAGAFGAYGWVLIFALTGLFVGAQYLDAGLGGQALTLVLLSSFLPLGLGIFLWRSQGEIDESTKNVRNLASQLSEVASKSEIVINAIGDGVIAVDSKGTIQLINPAAQEILGWGKQDALMLSYKSILKLVNQSNAELEASADPIQEVLNTNQQARSNKLTAITQSGKKISIAMVVSPIGDMGSGVIIVFRDTTKEKAEEREQAEFISTASHEMRTPVASIEGYLGLALNPNTAQIDDKAREFIMKAHEAAQHLGRLFQDLLDVSRSEDGRLANTPKVVDVVSYAGTITEGLVQKATDKGLQLIYKPTDSNGQKQIMPVYYVNQDNDHMREIIDNLIENAIKYTPTGSVTVDVTGTDEKVIVSVQDTGLGIPTEDIPHLFQKFYRVDNLDRQQIGGTGLGLYLSRRLAEAMQGRLWVESVYKQGSTFFLELPRISTQEAEHLKAQQVTTAPAEAPVAPTVTEEPTMSLGVPETAPQAAPVTESPAPAARPATTVPRGESLTREQIAERVRQLEDMARKQREQPPQRPEA